MSKTIRVIVVENQAVVRQGLIAILSFYDDIMVVGEAENGQKAIEVVKELKPDIVLLDLVMPVLDGLDTIPRLLAIAPETRILVVTGYSEAEKIFRAIKLGALGYLLKDSSHEQLVDAIKSVYQGEAFIPPSMALRMIRDMNEFSSAPNNDRLTEREFETLKLVAQGLSNQDISRKLFVHESTIAKYVGNILRKLQLENRTQAALYAVRKGMIND
ncbi:MAG: response regulator transcription factor [Anaerolineae bacterium]|jgi:two-component system, NarL family, response regulator LiaR|nr:response regulator transcription factor [Anaerolineae bacterium]